MDTHQKIEHIPIVTLQWFELPQQQNVNMWLWIQTNQTPHQTSIIFVGWEMIPNEDIASRWQKSITHVCVSITSYYFHKTQLVWWYATHDQEIDEPNMVTHVLKD